MSEEFQIVLPDEILPLALIFPSRVSGICWMLRDRYVILFDTFKGESVGIRRERLVLGQGIWSGKVRDDGRIAVF